jgi:hypothetical protein
MMLGVWRSLRCCCGMDAQIQALTARVARQDERIAQLERRLNRSWGNSSVPPSADLPASTPRRGKDPSGRRQGAQPGHEGKGRPLLPAWAVDGVIEYWPERCGCGHAFAPGERVAVGEPVRWQVEELPVISVRVTEHQCYRVCCPGCGRRRRAELPPHIAQSAFGPRFQAAVATLCTGSVQLRERRRISAASSAARNIDVWRRLRTLHACGDPSSSDTPRPGPQTTRDRPRW